MLWVDVERWGSDGIRLEYRIEGDHGSIVLPPLSDMPPQRTDGLWKTTCMEVFVRAGLVDSYIEVNFSPSMQWAAYRFDSYRAKMRPLDILEPGGTLMVQPTKLSISFPLFLSEQGVRCLSSTWHLGLSAVIEEIDGTKSYWALRHPPGPPDFHHPDCFALELPAPGAA